MIIPMISVMAKVNHAVQQLAATECSYADFVSVLRDTRESYQISQAKMAKLLNVAQGTISKFESMAMGVKLDFFISYAYTLGFYIDIDNEFSDVVLSFQKRQRQIIKELSAMEPRSIENIYMDIHKAKRDGKLNTPIFSATRSKKSIIKKMLAAKNKINHDRLAAQKDRIKYFEKTGKHFYCYSGIDQILTTEFLSQHLKVSKKAIRHFENGDDCAFSASIVFQYADLAEARLKLTPALHSPEESPGTFYIRNFIALHGNMRKLKQVITLLASTLTRDKYAAFVSVLRCIREAYQVSQKEMAALLSTTQSTISKFESLSLDVKLEFLILYASVFGYHISVEKAAVTHDELFHFRIRQDEISKRFSKRTRISEDIYPVISLDLGLLESSAVLNKKRILEELLWAKHMVNGERVTTLKVCVDYSNEYQQDLYHLFSDEAMEEITTKFLSQKLGVSERTVRRFENDDDSEASVRFVFAYAALVEKDLILQPALQGPFEYLWHFYLRNCIALHGTIKDILKGSHQKSDGFPV